ncbi:MAG: ABC transporter ATP-binding protein [Hyphomicrobiales bacterium]
MPPERLSLSGVTKRFGAVTAVDRVGFSVEEGEFLGLLGPSGCGKTTLLRLIAGFDLPDEGSIVSRGRDIAAVPSYRRNFGVVFQSYALFPHMTVLENVGYGLKVRGVGKAQAAERTRAALQRVGMHLEEDRFPSQISGGQQQRVALARAIVIEPDILLLDEPLSALDKNLREEMQVELRQLQQRIGITTIFVTHDQEEALTLSDRVAVMHSGKIMQLDVPREIYNRPTSQFVATFLGTTNLVPGKVATVAGGRARLDIAGTPVGARCKEGALRPGAEALVAVRPEDVRIAAGGVGIAGRVEDVLFQGHRLIVLFRTDTGQELRAFARPADWRLDKGAAAFACWDEEVASVFTPDAPAEDASPAPASIPADERKA